MKGMDVRAKNIGALEADVGLAVPSTVVTEIHDAVLHACPKIARLAVASAAPKLLPRKSTYLDPVTATLAELL